jgi:hypothetical protein
MNITNYISECIVNKKPITFSKYGDGELFCVNQTSNTNADFEKYTPELRDMLLAAFKYLVNEYEHGYVGLWHDQSCMQFWEQFANKPIKWAYFHSILIDNDDMVLKNNILWDKVNMYKTIKESKMNKIIICNPLLIKAKYLLDIDHVVQVPFRNWIDTQMNSYIELLKQIIGEDGNHIVITCCGIASRILIPELVKIFPRGIYLDFGSAIDLICTKRDSRGRGDNFVYDEVKEVMKELLPPDWEDPKYEEIYHHAKIHMGVHLPK